MDEWEICLSFSQAKNKREQIEILAQLTASDVETILTILHTNGLCVDEGICRRCSRKTQRYLGRLCWECFWRKEEQRAEKSNMRKLYKDCIARNSVKINGLAREIARLIAENERMEGELKTL